MTRTLMAVLSLMILSACGDPRGLTSSKSSNHKENLIPYSPQALKSCSLIVVPEGSLSSLKVPFERSALALALTVSGNFEGSDGWSNMANNFDGQGMSLGLLNQNLGTGSLQPLLLVMKNNYNSTLQNLFSSENVISLQNMLDRWKLDSSSAKPDVVSGLDQGQPFGFSDPSLTLFELANNHSVEWAQRSLYDAQGNFKSAFKFSFQNLATNRIYILQQIKTALLIHRQALKLMKDLSFNSLRSYLFFFDLVTQNGGLYSPYPPIRDESETQRLQTILAARLDQVRSRYRSDVKTRKLALIAGHGLVHGQEINLETTYCYRGNQAFFPPSDQ